MPSAKLVSPKRLKKFNVFNKKVCTWKEKSMNFHCIYFSTLIYICSLWKANVYSNRIWGLSTVWIISNSHNDSFYSVFSIWFFKDKILTRFLKFKIVGRLWTNYIYLLTELVREQSKCCLLHIWVSGTNLCTTLKKSILDSFVLLSYIYVITSIIWKWGPWYI